MDSSSRSTQNAPAGPPNNEDKQMPITSNTDKLRKFRAKKVQQHVHKQIDTKCARQTPKTNAPIASKVIAASHA